VLSIDGNITGSGPDGVVLNESSAGILTLKGTNTYLGTTTVNAGFLTIDSPTLNGSIPADLRIGNGVGTPGSAVVKELSSSNISNTSHVTIDRDGRLDLNGFSETIEGLSGAEPEAAITLGSGTLTISSVTSGGFAGVISGSGGITKTGTSGSHITLSGDNTYTGTTTVNSGTLVVNGDQPSSDVSVVGSGILLGSGTVGDVAAANGTIVSPGGNPLLATGGTAILKTGALTLSAGGAFDVDVNGTSAGGGYDRVAATGNVNLGGASLFVLLGISPPGGTVFTIVTTTGSLSGTFAGKPDGSSFCVGTTPFVIDYTPTSVVLTVSSIGPTVSAPAATTITQTTCQ
ncbi:MAG TPA: autotransporter-associated beta strand repeat-containing protein, partial [Thermoanaerobaculia bacterium]|nr:autotransporter-associated beta strand repeat-containing protein [Thermoanaerobaculia bacterium]